uniref:Tyrosine-protein kinase receptor n=1 Tax=Boisea trivittata TaxID=1255142 RepID=A0A2R4G8S6_9HEMI|nr:sevenless [Boisea trivittata]
MSDGVRHNGEQIVTVGPESNSTVFVRLQKLLPGQSYRISVRAYSENSETFSESSTIILSMFPEPPDIHLITATPYSLNISWPLELNSSTVSHEIEFIDFASNEYWLPVPLFTYDEEDEIYYLENLKPKSSYTFRLRIVYVDSEEEYIWPSDNRFTFRTLGDKPSRPGRPVVQHLSTGAYQLAWEPSRDNGAPVLSYILEGRQSQLSKRGANTSINEEDLWDQYYNGTDNYWKMTKDLQGEKYRFRVRALNNYGWSDYSDTGTFDLSQAGARLADSHDVTIILWVLTPTAIVVTVAFFICVMYRTKGSSKKVVVRADTELATLRELPRWSVQNTNALYSGTSPHPLPRLRRDQITLTKFLGSGAFGEVFEGLALSLNNSESHTRVAIKTLRKGANNQEKAEFLKEAQLMSNFRHPHILQLLGVCLDNDPHFIIMELMEGGDLLSYLRSNRPLMRAWDLLAMCVDVARGCCYLEEMHFVHRDLACRNCLVSSHDPATRVVKIGDFGLARDIYKNDYYRKEGEGLLPVRWMAPESLVDGVFTSQSDVWAFGVLLWEILSLGQQPYPARNNLEVLHYVRSGGRLSQPVAASSDMYCLMMKCWSFSPDERPTFKYCLDVLVELKSRIPNIITPPSPEIETSNDKKSEGGPKYLELVYEDEGGYEIPRSLEQTPEEDKSSLDKLLPGYTNVKSGVDPPTRLRTDVFVNKQMCV